MLRHLFYPVLTLGLKDDTLHGEVVDHRLVKQQLDVPLPPVVPPAQCESERI